MRSLHIILFHKLNADFKFRVETNMREEWRQVRKIPILPEFLLSCLVDMILQPLHVAETRFIMQNRQTNFSAYPSILSYFKNTPIRDMLRGNMLHAPRNFLVALQGLKFSNELSLVSYYASTIIS